MRQEPKWLRMKYDQTIVGQSTSLTVKEGFEAVEIKGQMSKVSGIVYELLSLRWYTTFWSAGAGWSYWLSWALSRSSTPKAVNFYLVPKNQDLIFQHVMLESDSYANPSHVERNSESVSNVHYFQHDCRPVCLKLPKLFGGLYMYYDGVPSRAWSTDVIVNVEYRILAVSAEAYEKYERAYGLQGV